MTELEPEEIESNFSTFVELCEKLGSRKEEALSLVESFAERLALCPGSWNRNYPGCYSGGLIDTNIKLLQKALKIKSALEISCNKKSLVIVCLFHNIGLLGTQDKELLLPSGDVFKFNPELHFMSVPDRSFLLLQEFKITLTEDEYIAIRTLLDANPASDLVALCQAAYRFL